MRLEPDKERFIDPDALTSAFVVHAVDISDERSPAQFITFWCRGKTLCDSWAITHGINPDNHQRDLYHLDDPWIPTTWPGKESQGWNKHCHVDLASPPKWGDFTPYLDGIPPKVQDAIRQHLAGV